MTTAAKECNASDPQRRYYASSPSTHDDICDANRFGQGPLPLKLLKLLLHSMGLWKLGDRLRTGGRGYMESEGDGIFYSYSAYASMDQLNAWADSIIVLPSSDRHRSATWFQPLITSPGVLVAACRHEDS